MWFIIVLVLILGGLYAFRRFDNWSKWKIGDQHKITEEKTIDEWVALINGAASKCDKTMEKLARAIQAEKIPNISISKKEIKLGRDPRPFLVIEHNFLKGYYMYVAALAYGEDRLNVVWYLVLDKLELTNYVTLVHGVVVDTTRELMKEQNLDFSKINTQTKGFLKLS